MMPSSLITLVYCILLENHTVEISCVKLCLIELLNLDDYPTKNERKTTLVQQKTKIFNKFLEQHEKTQTSTWK